MRDPAPNAVLPGPHVPLIAPLNRSPQPASPAVINMDDSLNDTKESQRKAETDDSILENSSAVSDLVQDDTSTHDSDNSEEPMDISTKTTIPDSDNSDCSSPRSENDNRKYFCPICDITHTSQHEFTLHIRSHNNDNNDIVTDKGFSCRICSKVLSSSSSLDRHVLVHSGERPFRCRICAVTFTTNGNMHRHMRTHKAGENYESDGSTDSTGSVSSGKGRNRRLEFNNNNDSLVNNSNKRKSDCFTNEDDDNCTNRRKTKHFNNNINELITQKYNCPVCDRQDFISLNVLETHLEDNHPDFEVRCASCNVTFKNHRALNQHRYKVHHSEQLNNINNKAIRNTHIGFKDLTFVDFSSEKFPHIARYACEKSLHKPVTGQKYVCNKCTLAFPCASALQIHEEECMRKNFELEHPTDLSRKTSDEEIRRDNFFSHLDLQKSASNSPTSSPTKEDRFQEAKSSDSKTDSKDLADIQSILSMTSNGSLLQHLRTKTPSELLALPQEPLRSSESHAEEETQDVFAAEFRKMKLRGEFPCRLCTAVFPNLRALKGHNRAHLTGSGHVGPYRCNMCPHSSIDKAALIRHMRTHNGDRPYECSLCNYAFTTKANCERHLRNRHAKVTREDVKKSIIYHPSEDPTNEEVNKLSSVTRSESKHNFLNIVSEEEDKKELITPDLRNIMIPQTLNLAIPTTVLNKDRSVPKDQPVIQINKDLQTFKDQKEDKTPFGFHKKPGYCFNSEFPENLDAKTTDGLKQIPDYDTGSEEESFTEDYVKPTECPIDLSMDVLDLSKKKEASKSKLVDEPHDFTKKTLESNPAVPPAPTAAQLLLAQQLLKNPYMHLSHFYQNPGFFSNLTNLNLPTPPYPFLFPPPFLSSPQEMKERMLRLQLSGGTMISEQFPSLTPNLQSFRHQSIPDLKFAPSSKQENEAKPSVHTNTQMDNGVKLHSPKPQQKSQDLSHNTNSVKMVIKNGVLMPKQKQRRYRTERPFSCEHCSARFTLRSNMERHIKQQHPQYWSQRQRIGISGVGRKPSSTPPSTVQSNTKAPFYDLNIPNYDLHVPKMQESLISDTKDQRDLQTNLPISRQVKYAILAQQLKAHGVNHTLSKDDDDDALIIDEENDDVDKYIKANTKESNDIVKIVDSELKPKSFDEKMLELRQIREKELKHNERVRHISDKEEAGQDLVPVSRLLDNAVSSQLPFREYFRRERDENEVEGISEEDEDGLVDSGSTSEGNGSGSDENKSENETVSNNEVTKKKSAYSLAPNRVSCPYCHRKFPWKSSLRRHVLTHTGQKPFKCSQCPLLFTTKSNCDRHLLRKHGNAPNANVDSTSNINNNNNNSQNYMMRNVPERPFKCSSCPSSTFSTLSNLKKHMSCKHMTNPSDLQKVEDVRSPSREYESFGSSEDERTSKKSDTKSDWENQISHTKSSTSDQTIQNADLPFKCHLCDSSYAERQEALDHIKEVHVTEYELLMAKGALDTSCAEEIHVNHEQDDDDHLRGKFPDYANRKVMCAFCMRRFWSAEDLRRHMRTHTGERPFSCDICNRRFTLKHSMLRHRKKHNLANTEDNLLASGDEEMPYDKMINIHNNNNVTPDIKMAEKSSEEDSEGNEGSDLIGNLLGIRDKSIIDQVLVSSADDAAKLLGVKSGHD